MGSPYKTFTQEEARLTVDLGPIPGLPWWHQQSVSCSYTFPTKEAAERFAASHILQHPNREITVR